MDIHTLLRAVTNLHSLSRDFMFDTQTTASVDWRSHPSRAQTGQSKPPFTASDDIQRYKHDIGSPWKVLTKQLSDVVEATRDNDDTFMTNEHLETFLDKVQKYKHLCLAHFSSLKYFDGENPVQREECKKAVRKTIAGMVSSLPRLWADQVLPEVLRQLPLNVKTPKAAADPQEESLRQRLAESIRRDYQGNAHRRLLNFAINVNRIFFDENPESKRPYLKGTPIVQSSGTGKTRMVLELGRISPLLFLCIRPIDATARNGYPLGDQPIMTFVSEECATSSLTRDEQAAVLLAAWFTTLASKLDEQPGPKQKSDFLVQLNNYGDTSQSLERDAFFQIVLSEARKLLPKTATPGDYKAIFDRHLNEPVYALSKQLREVLAFLAGDNLSADHGPVFVAIDECVTLPASLLDSIRRAWNHIGTLETENGPGTERRTVCFWLVLMSTNSGASSLVRPQQEQSSDRDKVAVRLPTFVGVGFDVLLTEQRPLSSAITAATEEHIKFYGRPLWQSLLIENFWATATQKLQGTARFTRGLPETCFNVLASRLALRYVPVRGATGSLFGEQLSFAHKAVDRHMRILAKVETDASLHIRSPSEPVLAVAASLIMMPTPLMAIHDVPVVGQEAGNRYASILETLHKNCLASADINILKGTRGELMARLLLMTAWDASKFSMPEFQTSEKEDWKAQQFLKPVTLNAILDGLVQLSESDARTVRDRIDKVCQTVRLQLTGDGGAAARVQAWTHFTHFDILETKVEEISSEYLWYCWKRGVGIQLSHPQHGIDGIIPVFVGDLDRPFVGTATAEPKSDSRQAKAGSSRRSKPADMHGEAEAARHMTYVAWEAKNRKRAGPADADGLAQKPKHAGPTLKHAAGAVSELSSRGLLTVLADMALESQPPRVAQIGRTDSLQVWIRGLDGVANYSCLDVLQIRNVAVNFLRRVSEYVDYNRDNLIPDPMALNAFSVASPATATAPSEVEDAEATLASSPLHCPTGERVEHEAMETA